MANRKPAVLVNGRLADLPAGDVLDVTAVDVGAQPLDATLTALAGMNSTAGLVEQIGADAFTKRAIGIAADTSIPTRADADARYTLAATVGQANGVASLDGAGKVPAAQLPNSIMEYKGVWDASTNTPTLADGSGNAGDVYRVTVAGTQNLGSGAISFGVGDYAVYSATGAWEKSDTTDAVASVAGKTGAVVLVAIDISDSTATGQSLVTAANADAARTALGLASGATTSVGTIATQNVDNVNIDGGAIDGTLIGAVTPATGAFTALSATGALLVGTTTNTEGALQKVYRTSGTTAPLLSVEAAVPSFTGASIEARNTLGASRSFDLFRGIVDSDGDVGGATTVFRVRGDGSVQSTGVVLATTAKTADYTVTTADHTIRADATSNAVIVTLPDASTCTGQVFVVKRIDATANTVAIATTAAQAIDGGASAPINVQYASLTVQSNGTGWDII